MHINEGWFLKDEVVVPDDKYSTVKARPFHLSLVYLHCIALNCSAFEDWMLNYVDADARKLFLLLSQSTSLKNLYGRQTQVGVRFWMFLSYSCDMLFPW
jgi:hypothetical protein